MSGVKHAPVLTIFIGGNHEASNVLQSLYYGGWVAPNIYFLGYAGVVQFGGLRIGGLSGIYHNRHYRVGQYVDVMFASSVCLHIDLILIPCPVLFCIPILPSYTFVAN